MLGDGQRMLGVQDYADLGGGCCQPGKASRHVSPSRKIGTGTDCRWRGRKAQGQYINDHDNGGINDVAKYSEEFPATKSHNRRGVKEEASTHSFEILILEYFEHDIISTDGQQPHDGWGPSHERPLEGAFVSSTSSKGRPSREWFAHSTGQWPPRPLPFAYCHWSFIWKSRLERTLYWTSLPGQSVGGV